MPLDTRVFPNGSYLLTVAASDVCGNRGTANETIRIANLTRAWFSLRPTSQAGTSRRLLADTVVRRSLQ
jgi:hypothetical protein